MLKDHFPAVRIAALKTLTSCIRDDTHIGVPLNRITDPLLRLVIQNIMFLHALTLGR